MAGHKPPEGAIDRGDPEELRKEEQRKQDLEEQGATIKFAETLPLLSDEELAELKETARKKVEKQIKERAKKIALEEFERQARIEAGLEEPKVEEDEVEIHLNFGPYTDRAVIDFTIYMHNGTYIVKRSLANVLAEACGRSWNHQREIKGERLDAEHYRMQGAQISGRTPTVGKVGNRQVDLSKVS